MKSTLFQTSSMSTLTSALQEAGSSIFNNHQNGADASNQTLMDARGGFQDSVMFGSFMESGAQPIQMQNRNRRESNTGSLVNGMSWGPGSLTSGSWVNDMIMMGTSPSAFHHSSSFQSSSYNPKTEANILKDFVCCGLKHATYHDFINHCEQQHPNQTMPLSQSFNNKSRLNSLSQPSQMLRTSSTSGLAGRPTLETIQDNETMGEMELDDTSMSPIASGFPTPSQTNATTFNLFSSNPTVSSVNTPSLATQSFNNDMITNFDNLGFNSMDNLNYNDMQMDMEFNNLGVGETIHDPATRLSSMDNPLDQSPVNFGLKNSNPLPGTEFQRSLQRQQIAAGIPVAGVMGFPGQEEKKFRCPVLGCEKAYKNQNGLKYHKTHGHNNQQLKQNADGTFSIVDPITSMPYPGTVGMEKEKPYSCEVCGKRYKNLNGLKYHRQHSPQCNPDGIVGISTSEPITPDIAIDDDFSALS